MHFFGDKSLDSLVFEQIVDNCCPDNAIVRRFTEPEQATHKNTLQLNLINLITPGKEKYAGYPMVSFPKLTHCSE